MELILVKIANNAFLLQNHFLGPKMHFGPKNALLVQKLIFGRKVWFWAKSALWNSHELTYMLSFFAIWRPWCPEKQFCSKNHFWLKIALLHFFAILDPKVHFLRKSALLRPHAADADNLMDFSSKWSPFWPKSDFGRKSTFWAPKSILALKMRKIS